LTFAPNEPDRDGVTPAFTGAAVRALVRRGDTLWIGTDIGVLALAPGEAQPRRLRATDGDSRLALPVAAMASADSIVVVATSRGDVLRLNSGTGRSLDTMSYLNSSRVGRVNGLAIDARTLWVAGDLGVSVTERATHLERFVPAGLAIPGEALGIALSNEFAWIAAREGAVRLRRTANGTLW
jgi:ligand-binding sensor domain-containing protein